MDLETKLESTIQELESLKHKTMIHEVQRKKKVIDQGITNEQGKNGFISDELEEAQCGATTIIYGQNKIRKKYVELKLGKRGLLILGSKEAGR
jgi:DNA-directed RNA polymerase subunit M/transcription elongation factor TFIIS